MEALTPVMQKLIHGLFYNNDPELLNHPLKEQHRLFIQQCLALTAANFLSTMSILNGLMLKLGFSESLTSIIALFPNIIGIVAIFAPLLWERIARRKRTILTMLSCARVLIFGLSLTAALPSRAQQPTFVMLSTLACLLTSSTTVALNIWFAAVVPKEIRGRYTSTRQMFALMVSVALPPCAGVLLDALGRSFFAYGVVFFMSMVFGFLEIYYFSRMEEPLYAPSPRPSIKSMFTVPIRNPQFVRYLSVVFFFYVIVQMSCAITQVYMLRYLQLSYTYITIMSSLSAVYQFIAYRSVGRLQDRFGPTRMMQAAFLLMGTEIFIWGFTPPQLMRFVIPIAYVFSAAGNATFNIAIFSRRYLLIPREGSSLYESMYIAVVGIGLLVGPVLGSFLRPAILAVPLFGGLQFAQFRVGYLLTTLLLLVLATLDHLAENRVKRLSTTTEAR